VKKRLGRSHRSDGSGFSLLGKGMKFILAILIYSLTSFGFCALGVYAILQNHPTAGGWLITGGIVAFIFINIRTNN
jgi:hypothetical protein